MNQRKLKMTKTLKSLLIGLGLVPSAESIKIASSSSSSKEGTNPGNAAESTSFLQIQGLLDAICCCRKRKANKVEAKAKQVKEQENNQMRKNSTYKQELGEFLNDLRKPEKADAKKQKEEKAAKKQKEEQKKRVRFREEDENGNVHTTYPGDKSKFVADPMGALSEKQKGVTEQERKQLKKDLIQHSMPKIPKAWDDDLDPYRKYSAFLWNKFLSSERNDPKDASEIEVIHGIIKKLLSHVKDLESRVKYLESVRDKYAPAEIDQHLESCEELLEDANTLREKYASRLILQ